MRSKIAQRILDKTPKDVDIFVRLYADIVLRVNQLLKEKGYTQKALAEKLDKKPSEIHKWLNGDHNFTLRSIAKLEAELGEPILQVPKRDKETVFDYHYGKKDYAIHRVLCLQHSEHATVKWQSKISSASKKLIADVGEASF